MEDKTTKVAVSGGRHLSEQDKSREQELFNKINQVGTKVPNSQPHTPSTQESSVPVQPIPQKSIVDISEPIPQPELITMPKPPTPTQPKVEEKTAETVVPINVTTQPVLEKNTPELTTTRHPEMIVIPKAPQEEKQEQKTLVAPAITSDISKTLPKDLLASLGENQPEPDVVFEEKVEEENGVEMLHKETPQAPIPTPPTENAPLSAIPPVQDIPPITETIPPKTLEEKSGMTIIRPEIKVGDLYREAPSIPRQKYQTLSDEVASFTKQIAGIDPKQSEGEIRPQPQIEAIRQSAQGGLVRAIRTFRGDAEEAIQAKNASEASFVLAEQKRKQEREIELAKVQVQKTSGVLVFMSILFILAGIGGAGFLAYKKGYVTLPAVPEALLRLLPKKTPSLTTPQTQSPTQTPSVNTLTISGADLSREIPLTDSNKIYFKQAFITEKKKEAQDGSITRIISTATPGNLDSAVDITTLMSLFEFRAPQALVRSLTGEGMLGLHRKGAVSEPFILAKTSFFEQTFASLIDWEKFMAVDFTGIFIDPQSIVPDKAFQDGVVENTDIKKLTDAHGAIILLYAFLDKNTFIITTNIDTFKEVKNRILKNKLER